MRKTDVIDELVGLDATSPLSAIRDRRQQARTNAQASYAALFEPADVGEVSLAERFAIAVFVAGLHGQDAIRDFYAAKLAAESPNGAFVEALGAEIERGATAGPYGAYPEGPLSQEDEDGLHYRPSGEAAAILRPRLIAALAHTHLLVFRPRDANPAALQALLDAGWSTTGIVTLSQLVSFLAFQIRTVAGLRVLAATRAA